MKNGGIDFRADGVYQFLISADKEEIFGFSGSGNSGPRPRLRIFRDLSNETSEGHCVRLRGLPSLLNDVSNTHLTLPTNREV